MWSLCKDGSLSSVSDLGVCGFQDLRQAVSPSLCLPQDDGVTVTEGLVVKYVLPVVTWSAQCGS